MDIKVNDAEFAYSNCEIYGIINGESVLVISCEDISEQNCCEDACLEYYRIINNEEVLIDEPEINNYTIIDIKYTDDQPRLFVYFKDEDPLIIEPNNNHNGYYSHTFEIKYMDEIIYAEVGKKPIDLNDVVSLLKLETCTL